MSHLPSQASRITALLALLGLALAAEAHEGSAPTTADEMLAAYPPDLVARLREEKVILLQEFSEAEAHGGMIHALVLFDRPRNEVLRMLIQSPREIEFRPELSRADLVEEYAGGHVIDYELRMMLMTMHYRARHAWDFDAGTLEWSLVPEADNDLAALEGRWELFALGPDRTLARFGTRIDVGPALPAYLQDLATRQKLPEAMRNVRLWVESGGTYRP